MNDHYDDPAPDELPDPWTWAGGEVGDSYGCLWMEAPNGLRASFDWQDVWSHHVLEVERITSYDEHGDPRTEHVRTERSRDADEVAKRLPDVLAEIVSEVEA